MIWDMLWHRVLHYLATCAIRPTLHGLFGGAVFNSLPCSIAFIIQVAQRGIEIARILPCTMSLVLASKCHVIAMLLPSMFADHTHTILDRVSGVPFCPCKHRSM